MRSRRKTTRQNILVKYISFALAIVSGLVMVPIYLKFIPVDIYGAWLASGNILVWIVAVDPGLTIVLQQQVGFAYGKQDTQSIREVAGGGLTIAAILTAFVILLGCFLAPYVPSLLELPASIDASVIVQPFLLAVIGNSLMLFSFSISSINSGLQGSLGVGIISIGSNLCGIILTIILLYNGFGLLAIAISSLFCGVFHTCGQFLYLLWRVIDEKIGFCFSFTNFSRLLKLLSYTSLGRISGIIAGNMDLFIVTRFLGPQAVAILSLTRKVPLLGGEIVTQPAVAFQPTISHLAGSGDENKKKEILLRLVRIELWVICLLFGGFITFNSDFISLWVGPQFFAGNIINLIVCSAVFINLGAYSLYIICIALGAIKRSSIASLAQSLLFILLVILGTKYYGLMGTVLASLISVLCVSAWYYPLLLYKLLNLSPEQLKGMIYEGSVTISAIVALILSLFWIHSNSWLGFFALVILFSSLYAGLLFILSKEFRIEIMNAVEQLKRIYLKIFI